MRQVPSTNTENSNGPSPAVVVGRGKLAPHLLHLLRRENDLHLDPRLTGEVGSQAQWSPREILKQWTESVESADSKGSDDKGPSPFSADERQVRGLPPKGAWVFLSISDMAIQNFIDFLVHTNAQWVRDIKWISPSGAVSIPQQKLNERGVWMVQLHPLYSFSDSLYTNVVYSEIPWGSTTYIQAQEVKGRFTWIETLFEIPEGKEALYHASAVLLANLPAILLARLKPTLEENKLDLLNYLPLLFRSLQNSLVRGSSALTGPWVRKDHVTLQKHRKSLEQNSLDDLSALYPQMEEIVRRIKSEPSVQQDSLHQTTSAQNPHLGRRSKDPA